MALSDLTYTALKQSVADFLAKSNLTAVIPDLIYLAETRLFRRLNLLDMEDVDTGTFTAGTATLDLPTGFRRTIALYINGTEHESFKIVSPDELFKSPLSADSGVPLLAAVIGSQYHFGPVPDAAYSYVHHYAGSLQRLSSSQAQNALLQSAPDVYLYASLLEAEPYIKNDPRIPVWQGFLEEAIKDLKVEDEAKRWRGGPLIPRAA